MPAPALSKAARNQESHWARFPRFLDELDKALKHSEADALLDRIVALERRVDDLSADRPQQ
jgi:hypothetical protein